MKKLHWVKSLLIRSYSGPYFLAFGLNIRDTSLKLHWYVKTI